MKLLKVLLLCLFISTIPVYGEIEEAVDPTSVSLRGIIEWVKNFDFVTYVGQTDNINAVNGRDGQWLIKETTAGISIYICWNGEWQPFIVSRLDNDIVETINLKDRSVTSVKIALSTIKGENVEPNTIEGSNLKDNSVITAKIADRNVTKPKLANSSVGNAQLENLSISSEKLRSGAVTSDKIAQELENKTIKLIDGSIAEPSLSFDNNSISGLSYNATDSQMIVSYNNTEKIRIDNDVTFINLSELKLNSNIDSAISFNDNNDLNKVMFKYHVASETFTIQSQPDIYSLGFTETGKLVFNAPTNVDINTYDALYPSYDVVLTGESVIENILSDKLTSTVIVLDGIASTSLPIGLPNSGVIYYNSTNNRFYGKSNDVWDILNVRNNDFTLAGLSEKSYNSLTDKPTIPTNSSFTLAGLSEKNFSSLNNKPTTLSGYGITDGVNTSDSRLSDMVGATTSMAGTTGLVPAPSAGEATRYLRSDGTWQVPPDTNTTYSANNGVSLTGTTFSNSGVRSITTGGTNGTISVNTNGTSADVAVKGLGTAAYTASTAYAASSHTHNYAGSSSAGGAATTAEKVNNALTITFDSGTTEGLDKFTFDGSESKAVNISTTQMIVVGSVSAGATIVIPENKTMVKILSDGIVDANAVTMPSGVEGQTMIIINKDEDTTSGDVYIPSGEAHQFVYIDSEWLYIVTSAP